MARIHRPPRNFNTALFTAVGTPLPLTNEEVLVYYAENVEFYIQLGGSTLFETTRYFSPSGTLFITTYRFVYVPTLPTSTFCSFFALCSGIQEIVTRGSAKLTLYLVLEGEREGKLKLNLRGNLADTAVANLKHARNYMNAVV